MPHRSSRAAVGGAAMFAVLFVAAAPHAGAPGGAVDAPTSLVLRVNGQPFEHEVGSVFALPGETIVLDVTGVSSGEASNLRIFAPRGALTSPSPNRWLWHAPGAAGLYAIRVSQPDGTSLLINAFVMVPSGAVSRGRLNGYSIGAYPPRTVKNDVVYAPPRGFVEVTPENENTLVSPHFRLRDFLCKQPGGYPKYVVLQEDLILTLERTLATLLAQGHAPASVGIMSAYRTPSYNRALGNVDFSMHLWGGAADLEVHADLNGDRRVDRKDASLLSELIESAGAAGGRSPAGGLGVYDATRAHGPFVHVDVRPVVARWGG